MSTFNRLPPVKPLSLLLILPTIVSIPTAYRQFQHHKLLNIVPLDIIEKRPEWADPDLFFSPYEGSVLRLAGFSCLKDDQLKNFSFERAGKVHRLCTNGLCPFFGAMTYAIVHKQIKYRLKVFTPLERMFFSSLCAAGVMSTLYVVMLHFAYHGHSGGPRMELKYELTHRIGVWLDSERDENWRDRVVFDEDTATFKPAERSLFRK